MEEKLIKTTEGKGHAYVPAVVIMGKPKPNPVPLGKTRCVHYSTVIFENRLSI